MIPIRDENPTRTTPYVVYALILLNVLFYIIDHVGVRQVAQGVSIPNLWSYYMVPASVVKGISVEAVISTNPPVTWTYISPHPTWITLFTSMFLHGSPIHLGGNMLYLWIFGNNIEDVLGHIKFAFFYLIGGAIGGLTHILSNPMSQVPTLGASGAIAAVMGAYLVLYPKSRVLTLVFIGFFVTTVAVPAVVVLGLWIGLQVLGGFFSSTASVAYFAHIGGFLAGAIGILLLGGRRLLQAQWRRQNDREYW